MLPYTWALFVEIDKIKVAQIQVIAIAVCFQYLLNVRISQNLDNVSIMTIPQCFDQTLIKLVPTFLELILR